MFMIHGNVNCHLAVVYDVLNLHLCGILLTHKMTYNVSSGMLKRTIPTTSVLPAGVLALDLEGVHDVKLHHPSSSVATSNQ